VVGLSAGGGLAALLAFHAADRIDAAVAVAAPPLLGRANTQDPREVLQTGLQIDPALALAGTARPAPVLLVQGRADAVVAMRCGEQLAAQVRRAHERSGNALHADAAREAAGQHVTDYRNADRLLLRTVWIESLGHVWTGGRGVHPFVQRDGPALATLALQFLRAATAPPA
jgi:poly(3-hydroxybutyrate) depolymerase